MKDAGSLDAEMRKKTTDTKLNIKKWKKKQVVKNRSLMLKWINIIGFFKQNKDKTRNNRKNKKIIKCNSVDCIYPSQYRQKFIIYLQKVANFRQNFNESLCIIFPNTKTWFVSTFFPNYYSFEHCRQNFRGAFIKAKLKVMCLFIFRSVVVLKLALIN